MAPEIVRKLVGGKWRTVEENPGGNGGSQPVWEAVTVPTDAASWTALDAPATVTADTAPTLPLTIVVATNDTFVYTPNGGSPETFTVAAGVYATLAPLIAAMAAAAGSARSERFDTIAVPSNSSGKIKLTSPTTKGAEQTSATIGEGNGGAAALGFTGNPDTFAGGYGGGWTVTAGVFTFDPSFGGIDNVICSTTNEWGQAWAVECEISLADYTSAATAFNAAAPLFNAPSGEEINGNGLQVTNSGGVTLRSDLYESAPDLAVVAVSDPTFHTYRVVNMPLVQLGYLDGVLVGQAHDSPTQNDSRFGALSRFLLFASSPGDQFRNLKAWRLPLPTLP